MNSICRIILADDHPIVRWGVTSLLEKYSQFRIVAQTADSTGLFDALEKTPADLVITDYAMPGGQYQDGVVMLDRLTRMYPAVKVIVLTLIKNPAILARIAASPVHGVLNKEGELEEIAIAVERVRAGHHYWGRSVTSALADVDIYRNSEPKNGRRTVTLSALSPREIEVIRLFLSGMPMTEIAVKSHRSIKTISNQKQSALRKLGCANDAELFQLKALSGLVECMK